MGKKLKIIGLGQNLDLQVVDEEPRMEFWGAHKIDENLARDYFVKRLKELDEAEKEIEKCGDVKAQAYVKIPEIDKKIAEEQKSLEEAVKDWEEKKAEFLDLEDPKEKGEQQELIDEAIALRDEIKVKLDSLENDKEKERDKIDNANKWIERNKKSRHFYEKDIVTEIGGRKYSLQMCSIAGLEFALIASKGHKGVVSPLRIVFRDEFEGEKTPIQKEVSTILPSKRQFNALELLLGNGEFPFSFAEKIYDNGNTGNGARDLSIVVTQEKYYDFELKKDCYQTVTKGRVRKRMASEVGDPPFIEIEVRYEIKTEKHHDDSYVGISEIDTKVRIKRIKYVDLDIDKERPRNRIVDEEFSFKAISDHYGDFQTETKTYMSTKINDDIITVEAEKTKRKKRSDIGKYFRNVADMIDAITGKTPHAMTTIPAYVDTMRTYINGTDEVGLIGRSIGRLFGKFFGRR